MVKYNSKFGGVTYKSDTVSAFAWRIGVSMLLPFSETVQFEGGVQHTQMTVNVDEVKGGGATVKADVSDIVNMPALTLGMRFTI